MKITIAFDPGDSTGLARTIGGNTYEVFIIPSRIVIASLLATHYSFQIEQVVIEDFIGGGRITTETRETLLLVGRLQGACEALGLPYAMHGPQVKDPFLFEAEKYLGRTRKAHADDDLSALAHLMAYEYRRDHASTIRLRPHAKAST